MDLLLHIFYPLPLFLPLILILLVISPILFILLLHCLQMNTFILDFLFEILDLEFVHELVVLWMVALRNYSHMLFNFFKHLLLHFAYD
jgi:hypothetical protein